MKIKWTFLCYFLLPLIAFTQDYYQQFEFKISTDESGLYTVYWRPNIDLNNYIIGSGQISFYAPTNSFEVTDLTSYTGVWNEQVDIISNHERSKDRDYFFIGLQNGEPHRSVKKEEEIVLVTFRNARNCTEGVELLGEGDPLFIYFDSLLNICPNCDLNFNPNLDLAIFDIEKERVHNIKGIYDLGNTSCSDGLTTSPYGYAPTALSVAPNIAEEFRKIQLGTPVKDKTDIDIVDFYNEKLIPLNEEEESVYLSLDRSRLSQRMSLNDENDNFNRPFEFKITSDHTGLYSVYWKPNVDLEKYVIGSGQIIFSVPRESFEPTDLISYNGLWNDQIEIISFPEISKDRDYICIRLYDGQPYPPVEKDDEVLLVTFKNAKKGCPGKIELLDGENEFTVYMDSLINACPNCTFGFYPDNDLSTYDFLSERVYNVGGVYDKGSADCPRLFTTEIYEVTTTPFSAFPNPANNLINIQIDKPLNQDVEILLSNIAGQIINTTSLLAGNISTIINVEDINEGLYFIQFNEHHYRTTKKVMVFRN